MLRLSKRDLAKQRSMHVWKDGADAACRFVFVFTVFAATDSVQTTSTISMQVKLALSSVDALNYHNFV